MFNKQLYLLLVLTPFLLTQAWAMDIIPAKVKITQRKITAKEAAAGLVTGEKMPLQYGFVFNMAGNYENGFDYGIESGDYLSRWSYYHQDGHLWSNETLETMFAYGMLNYYIQDALSLNVDLNVDYYIVKPDDQIKNKDLIPNKYETWKSLSNFLNLPEDMPAEKKGELIWQAMKRLKFLLDSCPRQIPDEIINIGAMYQRYKIALEKYSRLVDYNKLAKLNSLLDILQRSIIDFVHANKEAIAHFLGDTTKTFEYYPGIVKDHEIVFHPQAAPKDVLNLLRISNINKPFSRFNDKFIKEVEERLAGFEVVNE